jgi:deazaflavin-dependent oxidoreductase (nitroreductase family)
MPSTISERLARVANIGTLKLIHRGRKSGKEYEVTIWFLVDGEGARLFLPTANRTRNWVKNAIKTPRIRLKIGDDSFQGDAQILERREDREHVMSLVMRKYWYAAPMMLIARLLMSVGLVTDTTAAFEVKLSES